MEEEENDAETEEKTDENEGKRREGRERNGRRKGKRRTKDHVCSETRKGIFFGRNGRENREIKCTREQYF